MTTDLTAEQTAIRDTVREVAREEVRPAARGADSFPEPVWETLAELDLTGLTTPTEYGGFEADRLSYALVNEELAAGSLSVATALSVHCLACSCIASFAEESVREEWLPEMATGRPVGAFGLSEPEAGSNPAEMSTTARRADDEWVLDGEKQWLTNGKRSGVVIVFAQTDAGVTQFLVPKDTPGLSVGPKEDKLGLRASDTTPLSLDGVRVPDRYRLTEPGRGLSAALEVLTGGRIGIAAQAVGLGQAAYEHAREYAGDREQFDQPIGEFQSIRHKLAEMRTTVQAGRLLTRDAARRLEHGEDARAAASMAKYFASEGAMEVTNEAVQIHGGYGYTTEYPVEQLYRDAKITTIYEGTTQIQKTIIGRDIFGEL